MKILFVGIGLTPYYNQILNALSREPDMEIVNLVSTEADGYEEQAIFQSRNDLTFSVVELKSSTKKKYFGNTLHSFKKISELLKDVRPDIIVTSEVYLKMFVYEKKVHQTVKDLGIKILLKDIPFRLPRYDIAREKIFSGQRDYRALPFVQSLYVRCLDKMGLKKCSNDVLLQALDERKKLFQSADGHVNYVEEAYDVFGSYGIPKEKIIIISNSPDTDLLFNIREKIEQEPAILPTNNHRLIHVGRLIPWKRVDMLIEAFATIKKEFTDAELLIVGYGPEEEALKKLAQTAGVGASVQFIGGVYDPEMLGRYLLASSMYVLAGMGGISINDAMVFGKPVICSVCDGTERKLVREGYNGLYFQDGSRQDLEDKITYAFRNENKMKTMGEHSTRIIHDEINIHTVIQGYKKAFEYVTRNT